MVGFSWSSTVTSWLAVAVLPLASVTVQVTVVLPLAKLAGASLPTVAPGQLSLMLGSAERRAGAERRSRWAPAHSTERAVMVGLSRSSTVTNWLAVAGLPLASLPGPGP